MAGEFVPLDHVTEAHFDKYFGINVKGTPFTVQKALPLMPPGGAIVINGSMVSIKGIPAFGVYAATKAALRSFARTWAVDLKNRKLRVNVISPGTVITPGYKSELGLSDEQIAQFEAQAAATTPLGRAGTPDESPTPSSSWRRTKAATSTASNSLSMAVRPRSDRSFSALHLIVYD